MMTKKHKDDQRQSGREPASEEFPQNDLGAGNRFGQQRKDGPVFLFRRNLPGRGDHGHDQVDTQMSSKQTSFT